jgi:lysophospholipid acyltransferase (LPLAT)-like uncharacterized protein
MVETHPNHTEPRRPAQGVVVPHRLKWHQRLVASLIYSAIRLISATLRWRWELHPELVKADLGPVIFGVWHNRLCLALTMYERFMEQRRRQPRMAAIVSASRDGGMVARILEHFGVQPVRGSTSRRGPQALLELTTWAERGYDLAITPDGPRGPRYVVQHGLVSLAGLTGLPIIPASFELKWKISLKSWDRFQVPIPFSLCVVRGGAPIRVPPIRSDAEREKFRREIEESLRRVTVD